MTEHTPDLLLARERQWCFLCAGADDDEGFDYCRACGRKAVPLQFGAPVIARAPDLLAEVTRLRAVNAGLVEALKIAEAQFGFYGLSHRAKGTPDADAKAETNEKLVETMSAALRAAEEASA